MINSGFLYLITTLFLLLTYEILRRSKTIAWIFLVGVPVLFSYYWIVVDQEQSFSLFAWAKLYSLFLGCSTILLLRFFNLRGKFLKAIMYVLLLLNIGEAVVVDFTETKNYMNALAGLALMISAPTPRWIRIDASSPYRDLFYPIPFYWILGYSLWNCAFILNYYPEGTSIHLALYTAAIFITLLRKGHWMQARAFTLTLVIYLYFFCDKYFESIFLQITPYNGLAKVIGMYDLIFMIGVIGYNMYKTKSLSGASAVKSK